MNPLWIGDKVRINHSDSTYGVITDIVGPGFFRIQMVISYKSTSAGNSIDRNSRLLKRINKIEEYLYF